MDANKMKDTAAKLIDEVVDAMEEIGEKMDNSLRETALGGLAATKTAKRITKDLQS